MVYALAPSPQEEQTGSRQTKKPEDVATKNLGGETAATILKNPVINETLAPFNRQKKNISYTVAEKMEMAES